MADITDRHAHVLIDATWELLKADAPWVAYEDSDLGDRVKYLTTLTEARDALEEALNTGRMTFTREG
jgi:hypothetical protein